MKTEGTVEYNSLSWVKKQLDTVLHDAQTSLSEHIENPEDTSFIQGCIDHLRLVHGTLLMVEVYGASMLSEEMEATAQAVLDGKVDNTDDAYDVLMRAMLQLPDYLEGLQAGNKDTPIALMPLMNDLRTARNEKLLSESVLFIPDIDSTAIDDLDENVVQAEEGQLVKEAKRLRTHYQLGMLDVIKNNKANAGYKRMGAVVGALVKVSNDAAVRRFWLVAMSLFDSLLDESADSGLSVNKLISGIDRQVKILVDSGDSYFTENYSKELLKNILYYVGRSKSTAERVLRVKKAYKLDELIPSQDDISDIGASMGGFNAELFDTVSKGIREDHNSVKDTLEIFMQSSDKDVTALSSLVPLLEKIGDTYGMLSMGAVRQKVMDQKDAMAKIIAREMEATEQNVMNIASALLNAELELDTYIAEKSGLKDTELDSGDRIVPASEYRKVLNTVVQQGLDNFEEAKDAILSYAAGIGDEEQLDIILNKLEEVRGASMMLPMGRVEDLINRMINYVKVAFVGYQRRPELEEQDTIADVVTSIEYYLEAVAEGRPGVDIGLDAGEAAADKLDEILDEYEGRPFTQSVDEPVGDEKAIESAVEESGQHKITTPVTGDVQLEPEAIEEAPIASVVSQVADTAPTEEYEVLSEGADEEIVEIFIEEGIEVLEALHENLPKWRVNNNDEEALTIVRRSFHTLKGSGRLIGAMLIGEFAWKFESMLNRVIEHKIQPDETMYGLLDEALGVLPQMIEQLKGNREPIPHLYNLMAAVDTISDGGVLPPAIASEEIIQTEGVVEPDAEDVLLDELPGSEPVIDESAELDEVSVAPDVEEVTVTDEELANKDAVTEAAVIETVVIEEAADEAVMLNLDDLLEEPESASTDLDEISLLDINDDPDSESDEFEVTLEEVTKDTGYTEEDSYIKSIFSTEEDKEDDDREVVNLAEMDLEESVELSVSGDEELISLDDDFQFDEGGIETEVVSEDGRLAEEPVDLALISEALDEEDSLQNLDEFTTGEHIEESADEVDEMEAKLGMDSVLFNIYFDESLGHLATLKDLLAMHDSGEQKLTAEKDIIRAFHTLFGSARTAGVDAIADVSRGAEKYVKNLEESNDVLVPPENVELIRDVVNSIDAMLDDLKAVKLPDSDNALLDRINLAVQEVIRTQILESSALESANESDNFNQLSASDAVAEYTYGDVDDDLIDIFLEEAEELLEECESGISSMESNIDDTNSIHALQRHMHTLKGGARMASLTSVGDLTHILEAMVVDLSEHKIKAGRFFFDVLHESLDSLSTMLESVKRRQPLQPATQLIAKIEAVLRGETHEMRSVERYDVDVNELDVDETPEIIHEAVAVVVPVEVAPVEAAEEYSEDLSFDLAALEGAEQEVDELPIEGLVSDEPSVSEPSIDEPLISEPTVTDSTAPDYEAPESGTNVASLRRDSDKADKPHWGERATDVNFKDTHEQVRVRADLLNNLVNYAGEVSIHHARMGKQMTDIGFNLKELNSTVVRLKEQLRKLEIETEIQTRSSYEKESDDYDENFDPLEMDRYSTLQQLTRSLAETASDVESIKGFLSEIVAESETLLMQESRISTDLQEGLMRTRMVRFGGMSTRLRRIVRQTARELNKEVDVVIVGEDNEVDRTVLDRMVAPLEHMLRNAVAHGIETPDERVRLGKKEAGNITIMVGRQGPDVIVKVTDDGSGINTDAIREKAIQQGLIEADSQLSDHEVLQFILKSGFSTADSVSQVAGRGVGMDVVDSEIKQLGGVLEIDTEAGSGTTFRIRLPLTLAMNQAVLVGSGDDIYAVPLSSIEGVVRVSGAELQSFYDSENQHYEFNGVSYELKHLGNVLTGELPNYANQYQLFPVLLAKVGEQFFALHVDDMFGRREIVVKPVGVQIGMVRGIAGATILADGRVVLIIEMSALVIGDSLFRKADKDSDVAPPEVVENVEPTIMVVDDSITIRKVTARILERNNMKVMSATDGVDATNKLQDQIPDLMLLDIEMPRMDGFELATYMRNDERLKNIPIIMITSRTGTKHKDRAKEIGVEQYLGKPYQEEELMNNINELLKA